jgi:hypothetical protein
MAVHDEPVAQAASAFSSGANYQRLVYARTAAILETLARVHGKEAVALALGRYARRYRFGHPDPEQLVGVFQEVLGAGVAATLHTALFDKGWVDYVVDGVWSARARRAGGVFDRGGKRDKVEPGESDAEEWENSVTVRRRGTLSFPVEIELVMADGTKRRERWDGEGTSRTIAWRGAIALRGATVDPDDRVMIDSNLENNRASVPGGGGGAPRTLERVTYWMQLAVQAVAP